MRFKDPMRSVGEAGNGRPNRSRSKLRPTIMNTTRTGRLLPMNLGMNLRLRVPLLLAFVAVAGIAHAQLGVEVSPANARFTASAGAVLHGQISVRNPGKAVVKVTVLPSDIVLTGLGKLTTLPAGSVQESLAKWLNVSVSDLQLDPNSSTTYRYEIDVPSNATAGTHWGALLFRTPTNAANLGKNSVGVQVRGQLAFIVAVDVPPLAPSGAITSISYSTVKTDTSAKKAITIGFQNTGNAYMKLDGRVELRNGSGDLIATVPVKTAGSFPQSSIELEADPTKPLTPGKYVASAIINYGTQDLIAGQGTITVP